MLRKIVRLSLWLSLMLSVAGCGRWYSAAVQKGNDKPASAANTAARTGGVVPAGEARSFRGSVGNNRIEMRLVRDGEKLSGTYFYEKFGKNLDVKGTLDKAGNLTLQEFDAVGKQTGEFKGKWTEPGDESGVAIEGNWTKPNDKNEVFFYLLEQHVNFADGATIKSVQIKEDNKKSKYTIDVEYPQVKGSTDSRIEKFNQEISALINKEVGEWKKDAGIKPGEKDSTPSSMADDLSIGYNTRHATADLISIEFYASAYSRGAAHPSPYTFVVNYDLKSGRTLKLADLFQPGAKYLEAISSYSIEELKKKRLPDSPDEPLLTEEWIKEGAGADAENYQDWNITPKGLLITFEAYQVGPYAVGPQRVMVPYAALRDVIKADGPLAPLVKGN